MNKMALSKRNVWNNDTLCHIVAKELNKVSGAAFIILSLAMMLFLILIIRCRKKTSSFFIKSIFLMVMLCTLISNNLKIEMDDNLYFSSVIVIVFLFGTIFLIWGATEYFNMPENWKNGDLTSSRSLSKFYFEGLSILMLFVAVFLSVCESIVAIDTYKTKSFDPIKDSTLIAAHILAIVQKCVQSIICAFYLRNANYEPAKASKTAFYLKICSLVNFFMWIESIITAKVESEILTKDLLTKFAPALGKLYVAFMLEYRYGSCMLFLGYATHVEKKILEEGNEPHSIDISYHLKWIPWLICVVFWSLYAVFIHLISLLLYLLYFFVVKPIYHLLKICSNRNYDHCNFYQRCNCGKFVYWSLLIFGATAQFVLYLQYVITMNKWFNVIGILNEFAVISIHVLLIYKYRKTKNQQNESGQNLTAVAQYPQENTDNNIEGRNREEYVNIRDGQEAIRNNGGSIKYNCLAHDPYERLLYLLYHVGEHLKRCLDSLNKIVEKSEEELPLISTHQDDSANTEVTENNRLNAENYNNQQQEDLDSEPQKRWARLVITAMGIVATLYWFFKAVAHWALVANNLGKIFHRDDHDDEPKDDQLYITLFAVKFSFRFLALPLLVYFYKIASPNDCDDWKNRKLHWSVPIILCSFINSISDEVARQLISDPIKYLNAALQILFRIGMPLHLAFMLHLTLVFGLIFYISRDKKQTSNVNYETF